ncbi:tRNA (adenosine(37)-N6)-threonylcarbamoyltransferase complex transferase subunit TsaD [Parvularcula sp. LCG005]|uniref:tRNA (adenosine(37)-N6)-threonylcarbamoyltransferase complex transferase subunit TsaD n=1 Tax=Parvularcula sp. LCG005 TaxID=3078805 RepID=UPI0039793108
MTRPGTMTAQADRPLLVLGIESSCDDTAASVLRLDDGAQVLSSIVIGQDQAHAPYGGVVPEIAARAHAALIDGVVADALREADVTMQQIDLIAATAGPGLIGGVMSGFSFAKGLALATGLPLVPVNHLAGHALSVGLEEAVPFPYLLLLVSGGHTQILLVEDVDRFRRIGTTIDDAAGEAFDKTAKLLGLDGAGGPAIQRLAEQGNANAFTLPTPLANRPGCDFSFSGLKTAVRLLIADNEPLTEAMRADIAASFQAAAVDHLVRRVRRAFEGLAEDGGAPLHLVAAGGVAANTALRQQLGAVAEEFGARLVLPGFAFCTDNAAMIAYAGAQLYRRDPTCADGALSLAPRARWPLDEREANVTLGSGRKGRKA